MGKKGSKPESNAAYGPQISSNLSLRDEAKGKKPAVNAKSMLKLDHLKNLAVWSSSNEASIPPLAAFFGERLASSSEALGVPPDPSLFSCQRCESILRPGYNCTVRIEKNKSKQRRRKKSNVSSQNNVVYNCHFCSHKNTIKGTPKGYLKEICPPKAKPPPKQKPTKMVNATTKDTRDTKNGIIVLPDTKDTGDTKKGIIMLPDTVTEDIESKNPPTPSSLKPCTTPSLLDSKMRKRNRSGAKKPLQSEDTSVTKEAENAVSASSKRRRKGWTSLKEIVEGSEKDNSKNFANLTVPFFI